MWRCIGRKWQQPFGTGSTTEPFTITLAVLDQQCGAISEPSFSADETVQLQATLVDAAGMPIDGEIIVFASGLGTLNPSDALTDNQGIAQVTLSPALTDIGATVVSAQTEIDNLSLLASLNVEVQPINAINQNVLRFGHFDTDGVFVEGELGSLSHTLMAR